MPSTEMFPNGIKPTIRLDKVQQSISGSNEKVEYIDMDPILVYIINRKRSKQYTSVLVSKLQTIHNFIEYICPANFRSKRMTYQHKNDHEICLNDQSDKIMADIGISDECSIYTDVSIEYEPKKSRNTANNEKKEVQHSKKVAAPCATEHFIESAKAADASLDSTLYYSLSKCYVALSNILNSTAM